MLSCRGRFSPLPRLKGGLARKSRRLLSLHFPEVAFSLSIKPLLNERLYRKIEGEI